MSTNPYKGGHSFIDFMLERILQTINGKGEEAKTVGVKLSARERDLLELLRLDVG